MTILLTEIAFYGGLIAIALDCLDWWINKKYEVRLSSFVLRAWDYLDDLQRKMGCVSVLTVAPAWLYLLIASVIGLLAAVAIILSLAAGAAASSSGAMWYRFGPPIIALAMMALVFFVHGKWVIPWLEKHLGKRSNPLLTLLLSWLNYLLSYLPPVLVLSSPVLFADALGEELSDGFMVRTFVLMALFSFLPFGAGMLTFILIFGLMSLTALVLSITRLTLKIAEVVTRKISEAPNGPLLCMAGFVSTVAKLAKQFL